MAMPCVRRAWYCRRHEKVLRKGWVPERDFESTYPPEYRDGRRALLCCLKCFVCHQFLALRCIHCTVHVTRPMLNRICHPNQSSLVVVRVQNSGSIGSTFPRQPRAPILARVLPPRPTLRQWPNAIRLRRPIITIAVAQTIRTFAKPLYILTFIFLGLQSPPSYAKGWLETSRNLAGA